MKTGSKIPTVPINARLRTVHEATLKAIADRVAAHGTVCLPARLREHAIAGTPIGRSSSVGEIIGMMIMECARDMGLRVADPAHVATVGERPGENQ